MEIINTNNNKLMKRIHLLATTKLCLLMTAGILLSSCADTFDSDETFSGGVSNATLTSPESEGITITKSTDGSSMTIEWKVVYGAGGYEVKLFNASDEANPLINDTIDGCKMVVDCLEDTNYKLLVRTLGNDKLNNKEAAAATQKDFSTFTEAYAKIPAGDLYDYFQQNPISDTVAYSQELTFDLEPGGAYTVRKSLNFNYHKVVLRTTDKYNRATITLADSANFIVSNDFTLKYLNVDASTVTKPFMEAYKYSEEPTEEVGITKPKNYFLIDFVRLMDCNILGVMGSLFYDNNLSWAVVNFMVKNTIITMNTVTDRIKFESFISFQGGGIKDFSCVNSTIAQYGEGNSKYFLRYNNSVRVDRLGWTQSDHTTLTYTNNTFYKVANGQWANYSGIQNYTAYDCQNNIWYDCADGQIARRMMGNGRLGSNCTFNSVNNTYWHNGEQADQGNYDTSIQLTTNPAFVNPEELNFTVTGAEQVEKKTGDPRWFSYTPAE